MTYADNYELLTLAIKGRANSVTVELNEDVFRLTVPEVQEAWEALAPGDPFQILTINFE